MIKGKKILITGGAGFIGSNLCEYLVNDNQVTCLDNLLTGKIANIENLLDHPNFKFIEGDIRDFETCLEATKDKEIILHQAALGSVPRSIEQPLNTNAHNITGFLNMLEAARVSKIERFVYAASSSTYGDHPDLPKVEENIGAPLSPYAVTKYVNELYAGVYAKLHGMETIGLRYFNVFGRRQDPEGAYAAVIPKFIKRFFDHKEATINGDGEQTRDFTYIDNVIQANVLAATTKNKEALNTVYNIACGNTYSLNELVDTLKTSIEELGQGKMDFKVVHGPNRLGDIKHSYASIEKAKSFLNYEPEFDLKAGIREYLKDFR